VLAAIAARGLGLSELSSGNAIADVVIAAFAAFVITWVVAFIIRFLNASAHLYWEQKRLAEAAAPRVELLFPDECNSAGKDSTYRQSWTPLASGLPGPRISVHRFYVGARNPTNDRTLRNVRLVMEALRLGPGQVLNLSCMCERTQTPNVDIPPGGTEFFLIGEGIDESDAGIFRPKIMAASEYETLMQTINSHKEHSRFRLVSKTSNIPLLRNDGYKLELTAYADDIPPTAKVLTIDARNTIEFHFL
jgi:cbb3-type cytochrome oxidase subunit 3